jgi:hypothetical protein
LHFDHCGGSVQWNKEKTGYEPAKHKFWSNEKPLNGQQTQSERLLLSENILPMQDGQLNFIKRPETFSEQSELGFGIFFADHTDKQMIPHIQYKGKTIVLWRLLATTGYPYSYVMGYDTRPLLTMPED